MSAFSSDDDVLRAQARAGAARPTRPEETEAGTPFPWLPMVAIALCFVSVSYALCSLFPYAGYMVRHLGVTDNKDEAGFYAGYLSSAFMVGRFASSYFWGRFADTYGRLPVLYIGLWSVAFLSVAFGLSTTFVWAVACRFLLGALNGLVVTAKTMISEVCGSEHEVVGMSFVTGCWSVGLVLGSGLGGLLAEPAKHYPTMFSESGIFGRFPYFLPNILGAGLALIGLPMVFFFLEETLDVHKSGDRCSFESLPATELNFHDQEVTADEGGGVEMVCVDDGSDPLLKSSERAEVPGGVRGKTEYISVGNNGGCGDRSVQERVDKCLPRVNRSSRSPSGARELERVELRNVRDSAGGNARSERGDIRGGDGVNAGGGESQEGGRRVSFLRECLLPMNLLADKRVRTVLFVNVMFSFLIIGFDEAYPLWAISSVASGGMDWTTLDVGQVLAACGGGMLIFQLLVYPWIVKRIGSRRSQHWSCCVAIPVFFAYPFLSRLRDSEGVLMAASLTLLFLTNVAGNVMFINMALAINKAVDPSQCGTLNGLSMTLNSLATGAGPTVFSTIFAWSINRPHPFPLDGHLVFCLFALGMFVVTFTSWNIVISPVEPKLEGVSLLPVAVAEEATGGVEDTLMSSGT